MRRFANFSTKKVVSGSIFLLTSGVSWYTMAVFMSDSTTVHVKLTGPLKAKLDEMAKADRREKTQLVRLLIEDEWTRRQARQKGNGAQP